VPRTKSQEVALRNEAIVDMAGSRTRREVAETFGISESRVSQIIKNHREKTSADESRAMQDVRLEYVLEKLFERLRAPRQIKVSAAGKPIFMPDLDDPSGRTPDYSKPIYDDSTLIEVSRAIVTTLDRQAKLNALDTPKVKQVDENAEFQKAWTWAKHQRDLAMNYAARLAQYEQVELDAGDDDLIEEAEVVEEDPEED
jgi:hypothetical protein